MFKYLIFLFLFLQHIAFAQKGEDLIHLKFNHIQDYFVINMKLEKDWHVYWKNPGDSGIPTNWTFTAKNKSLDFEMLEWPAPHQFKEAGDLWTFGYKDEENFFAKIKKINDKNDEVQLVADFLVCRELCIPAKFNFNFDIKNGKIEIPSELTFDLTQMYLEEKIKNLPVEEKLPNHWQWTLYRLENTNQLRLVIDSFQENSLTPFLALPFNYKHLNVASTKAIFDIDWDGAYQEPAILLPENSDFPKPYFLKFLLHTDSTTNIVTFEAQKFKTINQLEWDEITKKAVEAPLASTSFILMMLFALVGGFILNFMPCVLPVITLKLYSLIHHQKKSQAELVKHNGSYVLGVLTCFWILAGTIITLRASGEFIGWGFQLQSPLFVWSMILLFFILSLNLFGLFEFKTPAGKIIGKLRSNHPYIDDYLSGLLAVVVATPCSAPFLGPALTYAFSSNSFTIFCMFTFMAIGLSLPFLLSALYPKSLKLLPRPGNWMNLFKYLMGFALIMTVVWLLEVLQNLTDFSVISFSLYTTLCLVFFSIFLSSKDRSHQTLRFFILFFALFNVYRSFQVISHHGEQNIESMSVNQWTPWSEESVETMLKNKEVFFIDATAKWCITCQVNKKLVFETESFEEFKKKQNFKTIRFDWTKRDPAMFQWLQKNGAVSVPAYFLGINGKIKFLGETISISKIENALQNP